MITRIAATGFRGKELNVELGEKTVLLGENMAGKTTLMDAGTLAILGYLPGQDKKRIFENASEDIMGVGATVNGTAIARSWGRNSNGSVSQAAQIDNKPVKPSSINDVIATTFDGPPVFDCPAFFDQSPRKQRRAVLRLAADSLDEVDTALDAEDSARKRLSTLREQAEAAEKNLSRLTARLTELPRPPGDREKIEADLKEQQDAHAELQKIVDQAAATDRTRKELQQAIAEAPKLTAERELLKKGYEAGKAKMEEIDKEIEAKSEAGSVASVGTLPARARQVIEEVLKGLDTLSGEILEAHDEIQGYITGLRELVPTEAQVTADNARREELLTEIRELRNAKGAIDREQKKRIERGSYIKRRLDEARTAQGRLDKLPQGTITQSDKTLTGIQTQIDTLQDQKEALSNWQTVSTEADAARLDRDKSKAEEETAKQSIKDAIEKAEALVASAAENLAERSARILPEGTIAAADNGDFKLVWRREGKPDVGRNSLSGYEKVMFDGAVARSLGGDTATVWIDAGECGNLNLFHALSQMSDAPGQVVVARWTDDEVPITNVPEGWKVVRL